LSDRVFNPEDDALEAYAVASDRARHIRAQWRELGEPVVALGGSTGRVPVEHPLLRAMKEAEMLESRLLDVVRRRHRGPSPSAVLGIPKSRSARLRAVAKNGGEDVVRRDWRKQGA
jgi:hypothetical protein